MADRRNNPKNPGSVLFKRLTRLFSGPIINYRTQTTRALRRRRLDKYSSKFKDVAGQKFQRHSYNPFDNLQANIMNAQNRAQRYMDFDQMEYTPEIASSMDIYADEMTTSSGLEEMLNISCGNEEIKAILTSLYFDILNVEFNLFGWSRTMCKYGDFFLYLDIDEKMGIKNVIGLPPQEVERLEGEDKTNPNYVQYQWNTGGVTFENWQIAHFRILGNDKYAPYGTSVLEPARRIWRQLTLLEDAMMAYRIVRSPERRVFYVDVGNVPPGDVEQYMQKVITSMKRNQIVDPETGRVDLRYNPMSVDEDYFIPVRGAVSTRVESLPGGTYTGDIDDVKYLRDKLFSALKIPQSYLSRGEGAEEDKTTLAQKDIRFARTVQRLQRAVISEIEKIGIIHLYTLGFRGDDLVSFSLTLNNPSKIAELQELEHWRVKFDTAAAATEGFFSRRWIADHMFGLSDEEFLRNQREMFYDRKFDATMEATAEAAGAEAAGAAMGAPPGGAPGMPPGPEAGMPPGPEAGMPPEGGPLEGEAPVEDMAGGEEAPPAPGEEGGDPLLASPGKRDDRATRKDALGRPSTTTSKSKGKWYKPVTTDTRDMGAFNRHLKGKWGNEVTKSTLRNTHKGALELLGLGRGISESEDTTYDKEEQQLFEINNVNKEIQDLLTSMESNDEIEA